MRPSPNTQPSISADSWRYSAGGDLTRDEIPNQSLWPAQELYSIELPPQIDSDRRRARVLPAADRGELFFQDGQRLWGLNLATGKPLPGWAKTYPGVGYYELPEEQGPTDQPQCEVALTDQSVLATMGRLVWPAGEKPGDKPYESRVVCLDRQTGRVNWVAAMSSLPGVPEKSRHMRFVGSPVVAAGGVLVLARMETHGDEKDPSGYPRGTTTITLSVIRLDLATGAYRWSCKIADVVILDDNLRDNLLPPVSPMSYADGLLYVVTNCGAVLAVNASGGAIRWTRSYPSLLDKKAVDEPVNLFGQEQSDPWPIVHNPPIIQHGRIFAIPDDDHELLILDAKSGAEIKHSSLRALGDNDDLARDMMRPLAWNTLVSIDADQAYLLGRHETISQLVCFDWLKYDNHDAAIVWASAPLLDEGGQPFLTHDFSFLNSKEHVMRIDRSGGFIQCVYPGTNSPWPATSGEQMGNILMSENHVIISGAQRITVHAVGPVLPNQH